MYKIVVLDGYALNPGDLSWQPLESLGDVTIYDRTKPEQVADRVQDAEVVLTNKTPIDADVIAKVNRFKYIGVLATGYDVVDVGAASKKQITVTNIPTYGTDSVAQMVFAHIFALCRRVEHHSNLVKEGAWTIAKDWCFWQSPQYELNTKVLGIVGFGRIGQQVSRIADSMGMTIQAYDPNISESDQFPDIRFVPLDALLRTSDIISLNCNLTPETTHMINRDTLNLMKPSAYVINVSRGGLIVDQDLANALNAGQIAGAGVDVLSVEPPSYDNPLLLAKNIMITPHIAWATHEARQRLLDQAVDNIRAYMDGTAVNIVGSQWL